MVFMRLILACGLLLLSTSCNKKDQTEVVTQSCTNPVQSKPMIIIGDNDWIDFRETGDDQQNDNERTVALVKIPAMLANCTGFLINENMLMTNNHCIGNASMAANVTATFREQDGSRATYNCSQFIMTNAIYDFTIIQCQNSPGLTFGWVGLSIDLPVIAEPIYVVQENCDYYTNPRCVMNKYLAFGEILKTQSSRINHNADTLGGSSGSPIFSHDTHQVIALHHAGTPPTNNEPAMNAGIPMYQIVDKILAFGSINIHEYGTAGQHTGPGSGTGSGTGTGSGIGTGIGSDSGAGSGTGTGIGSDSGAGSGTGTGNVDADNNDNRPVISCPPVN